MFKLVVFFTIIAFALARPGLYHPVVYLAPSYASVAIHEPAYAQVGSLVKSVPSAISHQSQSVVHSSAHVVQDVLSPVVKSTLYTTKSLVAPVYKTNAAPSIYVKTIAAPVLYKSYAAEAPVLYKSW